MNLQLSAVNDTRKSLVINLDKEEVDAQHAEVVGEYVRQARLPGFRPGKAPAPLVIKRFSKEIADDFRQRLVTKAYRDALEKEKIDVLNIVNVEEGTIAAGNPAAITVTLDVRPDFKLPEYVGIPTQVPTAEPTDAEIDGVIQALRGD
ncbi:MAG TPA: trigger factor family protein, partial [Opitutaceae bacterium]